MGFDITGARNAGYNDSDIVDYLSQKHKFDAAGARDAGYTDQEILGHLSTKEERPGLLSRAWKAVKDEGAKSVENLAKLPFAVEPILPEPVKQGLLHTVENMEAYRQHNAPPPPQGVMEHVADIGGHLAPWMAGGAIKSASQAPNLAQKAIGLVAPAAETGMIGNTVVDRTQAGVDAGESMPRTMAAAGLAGATTATMMRLKMGNAREAAGSAVALPVMGIYERAIQNQITDKPQLKQDVFNPVAIATDIAMGLGFSSLAHYGTVRRSNGIVDYVASKIENGEKVTPLEINTVRDIAKGGKGANAAKRAKGLDDYWNTKAYEPPPEEHAPVYDSYWPTEDADSDPYSSVNMGWRSEAERQQGAFQREYQRRPSSSDFITEEPNPYGGPLFGRMQIESGVTPAERSASVFDRGGEPRSRTDWEAVQGEIDRNFVDSLLPEQMAAGRQSRGLPVPEGRPYDIPGNYPFSRIGTELTSDFSPAERSAMVFEADIANRRLQERMDNALLAAQMAAGRETRDLPLSAGPLRDLPANDFGTDRFSTMSNRPRPTTPFEPRTQMFPGPETYTKYDWDYKQGAMPEPPPSGVDNGATVDAALAATINQGGRNERKSAAEKRSSKTVLPAAESSAQRYADDAAQRNANDAAAAGLQEGRGGQEGLLGTPGEATPPPILPDAPPKNRQEAPKFDVQQEISPAPSLPPASKGKVPDPASVLADILGPKGDAPTEPVAPPVAPAKSKAKATPAAPPDVLATILGPQGDDRPVVPKAAKPAPAPKAVATEPTVVRSKDFKETGEYLVTMPDGTIYGMYRDPENGGYHFTGNGHFSERAIPAWKKDEAAKKLQEMHDSNHPWLENADLYDGPREVPAAPAKRVIVRKAKDSIPEPPARTPEEPNVPKAFTAVEESGKPDIVLGQSLPKHPEVPGAYEGPVNGVMVRYFKGDNVDRPSYFVDVNGQPQKYLTKSSAELAINQEVKRRTRESAKATAEMPAAATPALEVVKRKKEKANPITKQLTPDDISVLGKAGITEDKLSEHVAEVVAAEKPKRAAVLKKISEQYGALKAKVKAILHRIASGMSAVAMVFQFHVADVPKVVKTNFVPRGSVHELAKDITAVGDNKGKPFIVIDKPTATASVYDASGTLKGTTPVLLGQAIGDRNHGGKWVDELTREEKTTPAGRYEASVTPPVAKDYDYGTVMRLDNDGIAIHKTYTGDPSENRLARYNQSPDNRRISFGCINAPEKFYNGVIRPTVEQAGNKSVVYITTDFPAPKTTTGYDSDRTVGGMGEGKQPVRREGQGTTLDFMGGQQAYEAFVASKTFKEMKATVQRIGQQIYQAGMQFKDFAGKLKEYAGEMWGKVKAHVEDAWRYAKSQVKEITTNDGSTSGMILPWTAQKPKSISNTHAAKLGLLAPAVTDKQGNVHPGSLGRSHYVIYEQIVNGGSAPIDTGFVTPDGKFLSRWEAAKWVKQNQPDVYKALSSKNELDSLDYAGAAGVEPSMKKSALGATWAAVNDRLSSERGSFSTKPLEATGEEPASLPETHEVSPLGRKIEIPKPLPTKKSVDVTDPKTPVPKVDDKGRDIMAQIPKTPEELKEKAKKIVATPWEDVKRIVTGALYNERGASQDTLNALYKRKGNIDMVMAYAELRIKDLAKHVAGWSEQERIDYLTKLRDGDVANLKGKAKEYFEVMDALGRTVWDRIVQLDPEMEKYRKDNHALTTLQWIRDGIDKVPDAKGGLYSPRRLEGAKNFLKRRSDLSIEEIQSLGRSLKSTDILKINMHTLMNELKYVETGFYLKEGMEAGRIKYLPDGLKMPEGYKYLPDVVADVHKKLLIPESVKGTEYVDAGIYQGLLKVAKDLGINPERVPSVGERLAAKGGKRTDGVLGYAARGTGETVTQNNTPMGVLAHEIGHQIDFKYDLYNKIVEEAEGFSPRTGNPSKAAAQKERGILREELAAIADLTGRAKAYSHSKVETMAQMVEAYVQAPEMMQTEAPHLYKAFDRYVREEFSGALKGLADLKAGIKYEKLGYDMSVPPPKYIKAFNVRDAEDKVVARFPQRRYAENFAIENGYLRANAKGEEVPNVRAWMVTPKFEHAGKWIVPEHEYRMLENSLSRDAIRANSVSNFLMDFKNKWTAIELISGFHYATITQEVVSSRMGLLLQQGIRAAYGGATGNKETKAEMEALGRTLSPTQWRSSFWLGHLAKEYMKDPKGFLANEKNKQLMQKWFGEDAPAMSELVTDYFQAGGNIVQDRDLRWGNIKESALSKIKKGHVVAGGMQIPEDIVRPLQAFLFEQYVPNSKFSDFALQYSYDLKQYAHEIERGLITKEELAQRNVRSAENRFGEMNWENFWMNRTYKSALQLLFRSFSWQFGTWRGFGTAFARIPNQIRMIRDAMKHGEIPPVDRDLAWLLTLTATHVLEAMAIGYTAAAITGNEELKPKEFLDFLFPKISALTRISVPGYVKEPISLAKDIEDSRFHIPMNFITSKFAGIYGKLGELWANKDFYGDRIYDPDASKGEQMADIAKFLMVKPFSVESSMREIKEGGGAGAIGLSVMGFNKAPAWISKSTALQMIQKYNSENVSQAGRAKEDAEDRDLKRQVVNHLRTGGTLDNLPPNLMARLETLNRQRQVNIVKEGNLTPVQSGFQNMRSLPEAVKVWGVMDAKEKADTAAMMAQKIAAYRIREAANPERLARMEKKTDAILAEINMIGERMSDVTSVEDQDVIDNHFAQSEEPAQQPSNDTKEEEERRRMGMFQMMMD